jgi:Rne/Rng family ribonuclease
MLFEGQTVLVQVIKDPIGTKGARLSTQISLAGRFLVHLPQEEHIGISQKIESESERHSLKARLEKLLPPETPRGYIIRTSAETASDDRRPTSNTCPSCGPTSATNRSTCRRKACCTKTCRWRCACCATW